MLYYKVWGFIRQSAVRIHLAAAKAVFKISGGQIPKSLFCSRGKPKKIGTTVKIVSRNEYSTDIAKLDADGNISGDDFVILSSTDFHFDEDHDLNTKTVEYFVRHIKETKPDLVVITGDVILTKFQQIDAIQFAQMMEKIGIYWTAVFGNHETRESRGFYKYLLLKSFADYEHCLCKFGPDELFGYGNYTVNILGKGGKLLKSLFFFDSGRSINDEIRAEYSLPADFSGYDFLKREQIDFYKKEIDRMKAKYGDLGSFVYLHIPLKEYEHAFKLNESGAYEPSGECEILYGEQYESVGSSPYNSGMFDAILEKGSTQAVFCGHDHINDWCAVYKGIYLVYSLPAGYNEYHLGTKTDKPESEWMQGVTLTTVRADGSFEIKPRYNRIFL